MSSIVEREAEESYPTQCWEDRPTVKRTFEADSDDLQEAYMNGRLHPASAEEVEAVAKRLMWNDYRHYWEHEYDMTPDEDYLWNRPAQTEERHEYLRFAKELLDIARGTVGKGLL